MSTTLTPKPRSTRQVELDPCLDLEKKIYLLGRPELLLNEFVASVAEDYWIGRPKFLLRPT